MHEHWSLVVDNISKAGWDQFLSGNYKTVGLDEAIRRLRKICKQSIPRDAERQFKEIAAHRNRIIHFFHEAGVTSAKRALKEKIAKEQCNCWFHVDRLLETWKDEFARFKPNIEQIRSSIKRNNAFLGVAFEKLKPAIEKETRAGAVFRICPGCGYMSSQVSKASKLLSTGSCLVCSLSDTIVEISCPRCEEKIRISSSQDNTRRCNECKFEVIAPDLASLMDKDTSLGAMNCAFCQTDGSVVRHGSTNVCVECLESGDVAQCEWCNEWQLGGDLEFSGFSGCEFCYGNPDFYGP